jgi:protein-S-isoprenylcysteine O-methyltransferase Ste14
MARRVDAQNHSNHDTSCSFALTVVLWQWVFKQSFSTLVNLFCIVGTLLAIYPIVWIGRRLLDLKPTIEQVARVTTAVHAILIALFGIAIIKAIQTGLDWRGLVIPFPRSLGFALVRITAIITAITVVNLAIRGFGAPWAIALSQRLATSWLYAWTRNPMVLALLACLIAVGLWLQSTLFVVWVLALVAPAEIMFLKVYEERELEIRFGEAYREYKTKTSFLWPRKSKMS